MESINKPSEAVERSAASLIFTIYCHTHIESGRRYIGQTKKTMLKRWNQHVYTANRETKGWSHFANAIRKYGKDAFSHEILEVCYDLDSANKAEKRWIAHFDTTNPEKGFNFKSGGDHQPHPIQNPWDRPEFRAKMAQVDRSHLQSSEVRQKLKVVLNTPECRAKRVAASKALMCTRPELHVSNYTAGKPISPDHKKKVGEANKRRDPTTLNKFIYSNTGKSTPEAKKAKLRIASTGRVKSPEELAKIAAAARNRKHSPEHLEKIAFKRHARDVARQASRTHFHCKIHGDIPLADCYQRTCQGHIRYECKSCKRSYRQHRQP